MHLYLNIDLAFTPFLVDRCNNLSSIDRIKCLPVQIWVTVKNYSRAVWELMLNKKSIITPWIAVLSKQKGVYSLSHKNMKRFCVIRTKVPLHNVYEYLKSKKKKKGVENLLLTFLSFTGKITFSTPSNVHDIKVYSDIKNLLCPFSLWNVINEFSFSHNRYFIEKCETTMFLKWSMKGRKVHFHKRN